MVESGLNVRSDVRSHYYMKLLASRQNVDFEDNRRQIDLSSVKELFEFTSYALISTILVSIVEIGFYTLYRISAPLDSQPNTQI